MPLLALSLGPRWDPLCHILGPSWHHLGPSGAQCLASWGHPVAILAHLGRPWGQHGARSAILTAIWPAQKATDSKPITCQTRSWIQSRTNHVYFEGALGSKSPCDHARAPSKTPLQHSYVPFWAYLASSWLHLGPSGAQCVASLGHLGPSGTPSCALSDLMSPPVTRQ